MEEKLYRVKVVCSMKYAMMNVNGTCIRMPNGSDKRKETACAKL